MDSLKRWPDCYPSPRSRHRRARPRHRPRAPTSVPACGMSHRLPRTPAALEGAGGATRNSPASELAPEAMCAPGAARMACFALAKPPIAEKWRPPPALGQVMVTIFAESEYAHAVVNSGAAVLGAQKSAPPVPAAAAGCRL